jgi:cell division protein ZipA
MMLNSTKYCQKRLGGTILNKNGEIFNEENERKELGDLITKMKAKGIVTGSDKALVMY